MKKLFIVSLWLIALSSFSNRTFAQCQRMFQDRLDWAGRPNSDGFDVGFKLTSNRADGRYVSYTEGVLKAERDSSNRTVGLFDPGQARQLFSDRKYTFGELHGCTTLQRLTNIPFDVIRSDALRVEVLRNPADDGRTLVVNTTLLSWGSGHETFIGECHGNLIFGFNNNTQTIFTLSLFNMTH
jgi:hypothetical protein